VRGVKLTFIFTHRPTLEETPREERMSTSIMLPEAVKDLDDLREQVLTIATRAAYFTEYSLYVHCPEAELRHHPVAQRESVFALTMNALCLYFDGVLNKDFRGGHQKRSRLYLYAPIPPPFQPANNRLSLNHSRYASPEQQDYVNRLRAVVEPLLALLNSAAGDRWSFTGFVPRQWQNRQARRYNKLGAKRRRAAAAAERQKQRLAEKIEAQKAQTDGSSTGPTTHGAGRMPGSRPGVYNGIQMRSQLEIRFAAELDERGIRWVYEGEALGAASYLVDFYLPDLGVWVEVKGRFEARDRQVLPEVARFLKIERKQRLLVYTSSGKCVVVNPSGFREIERKNFWTEIMK
jgi:hypothetical protein